MILIIIASAYAHLMCLVHYIWMSWCNNSNSFKYDTIIIDPPLTQAFRNWFLPMVFTADTIISSNAQVVGRHTSYNPSQVKHSNVRTFKILHISGCVSVLITKQFLVVIIEVDILHKCFLTILNVSISH